MPEKPCRVCKVVKDISAFSRNGKNLDGHRGECKKCQYQLNKASKERWYVNHYGSALNYARAYKLQKLGVDMATVPNKPACIKHPNAKFAFNAPQFMWYCMSCDHEKRHPGGRKASERRRKQRRTAQRYQLKYGDELANIYRELAKDAWEHPRPIDDRFEEAKRKLFESRFPELVFDNDSRVLRLNRISNKSAYSKGWKCMSCGTEESDPSFFDLDHIVERHRGGTNADSNFQILCPNCHKRKSLAYNRAKFRAPSSTTHAPPA